VIKEIATRLAFRRSGKPRRWVIFVLFKDGLIVRSKFRRIVYKKNGTVQPRFRLWMKQTQEQCAADTGSNNVDILRREELILQSLRPFEETSKSWRKKRLPGHLLDKEDLSGHLTSGSEVMRNLVISISHDDYVTVPGGVQVCIQREQKHAQERGLRYLQAYPLLPAPRLAHVDEEPDTLVSINLNGKKIGDCRMSTLINCITPDMVAAPVIVHHLLGHLPEQVMQLVQATGKGRCIFWLHDFFSICPSFFLQRNNLAFCGGPPVTSNACMLCVYGEERTDHAARIQKFFDLCEVDVASPSAFVAEVWQEKSCLQHASLTVIPHITIDQRPRAQARAPIDGPVIIAFLGSATDHKGWPVFASLIQEFSSDSRFKFVVLSTKRPQLGEDHWRDVHVSAAAPDAMSEAVGAEKVDLVLHWPTSRETFSLTTFEAIVGGAHIITHHESGNVARAVAETECGVVLDDEDDLRAFFRNGRAAELADQRRTKHRSFDVVQRHSQMSFSLNVKD